MTRTLKFTIYHLPRKLQEGNVFSWVFQFVCTNLDLIIQGPLAHPHPPRLAYYVSHTSVSKQTVTACEQSCGKVMFLHLSVILFRGMYMAGTCVAGGMHGRGGLHIWRCT